MARRRDGGGGLGGGGDGLGDGGGGGDGGSEGGGGLGGGPARGAEVARAAAARAAGSEVAVTEERKRKRVGGQEHRHTAATAAGKRWGDWPQITISKLCAEARGGFFSSRGPEHKKPQSPGKGKKDYLPTSILTVNMGIQVHEALQLSWLDRWCSAPSNEKEGKNSFRFIFGFMVKKTDSGAK